MTICTLWLVSPFYLVRINVLDLESQKYYNKAETQTDADI